MYPRVIATLGNLTLGGTLINLTTGGQATVSVAGGLFAIVIPVADLKYVN